MYILVLSFVFPRLSLELRFDSYWFILVKMNCVIAWALDLNNSDCCFVGKSFLLLFHKILVLKD